MATDDHGSSLSASLIRYVLERMLMALPGAPSLDVRVAAGTLGVLSVGNTAERLEAIFEAMGEPPAVRGEGVTKLSSEALLEILRALMATAQVGGLAEGDL